MKNVKNFFDSVLFSLDGRFRNWTKAGIWEKVFNELIKNDIVDYENLMIDSIIIKVHQHANGVKKGHHKQKNVQEED